jgi:hypothetical protein
VQAGSARRGAKRRSSTAMPWRCAFESPCFHGGSPDPGLCDPHPCPVGSGSRLYTRPASFVRAPNGQTIGSPSCYIDSTSMIEDHTWKSPHELPKTEHPGSDLRAPFYRSGWAAIRQEANLPPPLRRRVGWAFRGGAWGRPGGPGGGGLLPAGWGEVSTRNEQEGEGILDRINRMNRISGRRVIVGLSCQSR